jgi:hypothetical protein
MLAFLVSLVYRLLSIHQSIRILEKHNVSFLTDILAHSCTSPCSKEDICIVMLVMISHNLTNRLCRFPAIVERDSRTEMMRNVSLELVGLEEYIPR